MDSVPYLTHLDFVKGVRELNELCDYVAVDLTYDGSSAGILQFYKNPNALEKLLTQVNRCRMVEVGKAAALEYEKSLGMLDYSSSVSRVHSRNCLVSTVRPTLLMVQIDLDLLAEDQRMPFLRILTKFAQLNKIDGFILRQNDFTISEEAQLKYLRQNTDLIVVS